MLGFGRKKQMQVEIESLRTEIAEIRNTATELKLSDISGLAELFGAISSTAGPVVNTETAMRVSAVFACVRLVASCVSSSPLLVFRGNYGNSSRRGFQVVDTHPLANMLRLRPTPACSASMFWKQVIQNKLLSGNGYAVIVRKSGGQPACLVPIRARNVTPYQAWELALYGKKVTNDPYRLFYHVTFDDSAWMLLDQDDMLHFPNIGWDGKKGMSTVTAGAQSMGLALAAEEYSGRFFSQGAHPSGMLKYPAGAKITDPERIAAYFDNKYAGLINKHRPFVATEGGEWQQISVNANDAQLIESRQFSVVDICRFFGVPPVMIGETEKTTSWGSGVEQMARWFVMFTLNDHFTDIEQELETKLFRGDGYFAAFDERELTRGDTKTRADYYKAAIGGTQNPAWMTADEVRADEGLPPVADGQSTKLYRPADKEPDKAKTEGNADEKPAESTL